MTAKRQNNLKSAGTDVPADAASAAPKRTRKAIEPDQRTLTIRGGKRAHWATMLAALDGSADAIGALFGTVPPAEPVRPILADSDKSDVSKVLAHVESLNAYSDAMAAYPAAVEAYNAQNVSRSALRNAINAALLDIPLRTRKSASDNDE